MRLLLRKSQMAMAGLPANRPMAMHAPRPHASLQLVPSKHDPAVRRWMRVAETGHVTYDPAEAPGRFLREVHRAGGSLPITGTRADREHVRHLAKHGLVQVHANPLHHVHEYTARLAPLGRRHVEHMAAAEALAFQRAQTGLFKARLLVRLALAEQLGLWGRPTTVRQHMAANPGGRGMHLVHEHQRQVQPATEGETAAATPPPVKAGDRVEVAAVKVRRPDLDVEKREDRQYTAREARGLAYRDTETMAAEWEVPGLKGAEVVAGKGGEDKVVLDWDVPKDYQTAHTRWSQGGGSEGVCHLCGTGIKNVAYIVHRSKKLVMPVGSICVTKHIEALDPLRAEVSVKRATLKLKPGDVPLVNRYLQAGHDTEAAVGMARQVRQTMDRWDRKHPAPTAEVSTWWEQRRAQAGHLRKQLATRGWSGGPRLTEEEYQIQRAPHQGRRYGRAKPVDVQQELSHLEGYGAQFLGERPAGRFVLLPAGRWEYRGRHFELTPQNVALVQDRKAWAGDWTPALEAVAVKALGSVPRPYGNFEDLVHPGTGLHETAEDAHQRLRVKAEQEAEGGALQAHHPVLVQLAGLKKKRKLLDRDKATVREAWNAMPAERRVDARGAAHRLEERASDYAYDRAIEDLVRYHHDNPTAHRRAQ